MGTHPYRQRGVATQLVIERSLGARLAKKVLVLRPANSDTSRLPTRGMSVRGGAPHTPRGSKGQSTSRVLKNGECSPDESGCILAEVLLIWMKPIAMPTRTVPWRRPGGKTLVALASRKRWRQQHALARPSSLVQAARYHSAYRLLFTGLNTSIQWQCQREGI